MRTSSLISRLPAPILALGGLSLYFLVGWPLLGLVYPELSETSARIMSLAMPLPIFAFMAMWIWVEKRMGRRLMEPLSADPMPKSRAQISTERRATALVAAIASFLCMTPIVLALISGGRPGLGQFAPLIAWSWIVYVLGWVRLRQGAVLMTPPSAMPHDELEMRAERLLVGLALEKRQTKASVWGGTLQIGAVDGVPMVNARVWSVPQPDDEFDPESHEMDPSDEPAFAAALSEDLNRYKLAYHNGLRRNFDISAMSTHARMMAMNEVHAGRKIAEDLLD